MLVGGESRILVDGVDICERFGVLYTDESVRKPPEKRTNYIEIPAMDGVLDASELWTDDVVFGMRSETAVLYVPSELDFERVKTDLSNFLDGRRFDYSYTFDPGYTLSGRFRVSDYEGWRSHRITVEIDADPWKRGEHRHYDVEGAGGTEVAVQNSRRKVGPLITVQQPTLVEYHGRAWEILEAGTFRLDMRLDEGMSVVYVNSAPTYCDTTWEDLARRYPHWSDIPKGTRWSDVYVTKGDVPKGERYRVQIDYDLYDL